MQRSSKSTLSIMVFQLKPFVYSSFPTHVTLFAYLMILNSIA